jgi:aminodeoxyfutalosine deaminase
VYTTVSGLVTEPEDVTQLAKQHHGIKIGYIFDIASQDGADAARATLDHALEHPPQHLVGLGLGAERIGHGISCLQDPALVAYLRETQIPLEVCPTSNVCTGQVGDLAAHPLPRLLDEGLYVTLNSDDPAMFGTTLTNEYRVAARTLGLTRDQLATLAANGIRASYLSDAEKQAILAEFPT